jgi:hypothetical protein
VRGGIFQIAIMSPSEKGGKLGGRENGRAAERRAWVLEREGGKKKSLDSELDDEWWERSMQLQALLS